MGKVGYGGVANQANTSDGFALGVGAQNVIGGTDFGLDVGDDGVVDVYGGTPVTTFYIADETAPGYVLQEDDSKIILEAS
jgi:uncharacterized protein (DUF2342 family)